MSWSRSCSSIGEGVACRYPLPVRAGRCSRLLSRWQVSARVARVVARWWTCLCPRWHRCRTKHRSALILWRRRQHRLPPPRHIGTSQLARPLPSPPPHPPRHPPRLLHCHLLSPSQAHQHPHSRLNPQANQQPSKQTRLRRMTWHHLKVSWRSAARQRRQRARVTTRATNWLRTCSPRLQP